VTISVDEVFAALPARQGHFLLESGYHTDLWLTLDGLFTEPARVGPLVAALADRFRSYRVDGVCGPFVGGAFLAQLLAAALGVRFYYTEPDAPVARTGLFEARYRLPAELRRLVRGQRVAVVDDAISAGSSVRATIAALTAAGASVVAVGALVVLGRAAVDHFEQQRLPLETLGHRDFALWKPDDCPLCARGLALEDPRLD